MGRPLLPSCWKMLASQILLFSSLLMLKCALNRWVEYNSYQAVTSVECNLLSCICKVASVRTLCPEYLLPYRLVVQLLPLCFCESRGRGVYFVFKKYFEYALNIDYLVRCCCCSQIMSIKKRYCQAMHLSPWLKIRRRSIRQLGILLRQHSW